MLILWIGVCFIYFFMTGFITSRMDNIWIFLVCFVADIFIKILGIISILYTLEILDTNIRGSSFGFCIMIGSVVTYYCGHGYNRLLESGDDIAYHMVIYVPIVLPIVWVYFMRETFKQQIM